MIIFNQERSPILSLSSGLLLPLHHYNVGPKRRDRAQILSHHAGRKYYTHDNRQLPGFLTNLVGTLRGTLKSR